MPVNLAPINFSEFVGQEAVKKQIKVAIAGAKLRKEYLPHVLFHGPPGYGKTTLANIIASHMNSHMTSIVGGSITKLEDLENLIMQMKHGETLFLDEIHRLKPTLQEALYSVFDKNVWYKKDEMDNIYEEYLPDFTIIGATTEFGTLKRPLRDRFKRVWALTNYDISHLVEIVTMNVEKLGLNAHEKVVQYIAERSKLTPRLANKWLQHTRDVLHASEFDDLDDVDFDNIDFRTLPTLITPEIAELALDMAELDNYGLEPDDRLYIDSIVEKFNGGPVGLETLANTIDVDASTIKELHEPYLIRLGFVEIGSKGRTVTSRGSTYYTHNQLKKQGIEIPC